MINNLKLGSLSIICLLFCVSVYGQSNKFSFNIELSPNISMLTKAPLIADSKLSFNGLLRFVYEANNRISPTIGIGYLHTGEKLTPSTRERPLILSAKYSYSNNYVIIPIGAKISFGKFYVLPEIGLGCNISNKSKYEVNYSDGKQATGTAERTLIFGEFNMISIPVFLSWGSEFNLVKKVFSLGFKSYYGLNAIVKDVQEGRHYYGIGILLGMKL